MIIGFLDESSSHTKTNSRVWSFRKHTLIRNTVGPRVNIYGFYTLNGHSVVDFKEDGKTPCFLAFLETIREANPYRRILVILDNYKPHKTDEAQEKVEALGIILIYLPVYSPHLNPIEQIWRALKHQLSLLFRLTTEELENAIREIYRVLSTRKSFGENWIDIYTK